jgi:hypothetical protein
MMEASQHATAADQGCCIVCSMGMSAAALPSTPLLPLDIEWCCLLPVVHVCWTGNLPNMNRSEKSDSKLRLNLKHEALETGKWTLPIQPYQLGLQVRIAACL